MLVNMLQYCLKKKIKNKCQSQDIHQTQKPFLHMNIKSPNINSFNLLVINKSKDTKSTNQKKKKNTTMLTNMS